MVLAVVMKYIPLVVHLHPVAPTHQFNFLDEIDRARRGDLKILSARNQGGSVLHGLIA